VEIATLRRLVRGEPRLDVAHRVIAEIAGEAAAKTRQGGQRGRAIALHVFAQERKRIAVEAFNDSAAVLDLDAPSMRANANLRRQADERIAAEALAADDRLEQKRVALIGEL